MTCLLQDLRLSLKLITREPFFHLVALLTLGLTIGANAALFSVLNAVLFRPLPYPDPGKLVTLYNSYPGLGVDKAPNTAPDYLDRLEATDIFEQIAMFGPLSRNSGPEGSPERLRGVEATPSFFRILGAEPQIGRTFTEEETVLGSNYVAILSHGLWTRMFGASPDALSQDLVLGGRPFRIVGVMPAGFELYTPSTMQPPGDQFWVPLAFTEEERSDDARHSNIWEMIARLRAGVTIEQAQARVDSINRANEGLFPEYVELLRNARFRTVVTGLRAEQGRTLRQTLFLLQAGVALVLLAGCVNIANLLLVRASVRQREFTVRAALGASRGRIVRQLLIESLTLGLLGGLAGLLVGAAAIQLIHRFLAAEIPRGQGIAVDWRVLAFTLAVSAAVSVLFGSVPAVHAVRENLAGILRGGGRTGSADRVALFARAALVVAQVAVAFVLLAGAGLLAASLLRVLEVDPGFRPDRVLSAWLSLPNTRYVEDEQVSGFTTRVLESVGQLPGVRAAGMTNYLPFTGLIHGSAIEIEERPLQPGETPPVVAWNSVDSGYFAAMGIPLREGRLFRDSDTAGSPPVAIIDEALAERYWPGANPVGRRIRRGLEDSDPLFTIVGVVGAVRNNDLASGSTADAVYFHYRQYPSTTMMLVVRTDGDERAFPGTLQKGVLAVDAELPLYNVDSMADRIDESLSGRRATVILAAVFAGLALLLGSIGIYGVIAYSVSQRTQEVGVRMALGARPYDVIRMFVLHGLKLLGAGLIGGFAGAFVLMRLLASLLYGVRPTDPLVLLVASLVLASVAVLASLIPSLRAIRVKPAAALRHE